MYFFAYVLLLIEIRFVRGIFNKCGYAGAGKKRGDENSCFF